MEENTSNNRKTAHPIQWVPSAYFAMGMPFVVLNMVVVLMYKGLGVDNAQITLWTSLIILPWTLKPLWSPLLEMYRTKKFFVVTTQIVTGITFAAVAFSLHLPSFFAISIALLAIIAFSGATHDIACDGVYMTELSETDQAKYIGWQGAFYNIAKVVASGGFVYLAGYLINYFGGEPGASSDIVKIANENAWGIVMLVCSVTMIILGLYHIWVLPSRKRIKSSSNAKEQMHELWNVIVEFFHKKHITYYIFFIILYRFAEGFVMKIVPLPESSTFRRRTWIDRTTNRTVLWNIWCCSFRYRFDTGRILYFSFRTTQNIILTLLYLQSSICRICISGPLST